jgi:hypothetical protein
MSAHLGITSTIATTYGPTLASGTVADDCMKTTSVEVSEVLSASTGAIIEADPVNISRIETNVSGEGPHSLTLSAADIATPSTLTVVNVEITEAPNARCQFSIRSAGVVAFVDDPATPAEVGAEPTIADLKVKSVTYSIVESMRRSSSLEDKVLVGSDGAPAARGTITPRRTFDITGRGDKPAGLVLGSGGAEFVGATTGKVIALSVMEGEKRADWNRYSASGQHYLAA